jgi:hypothetical protein
MMRGERMMGRWTRWFLAGAVVTMASVAPALAQSTIFNIPSTDTVDKGKAYFEFDFLPQAPGPDSGASTLIFNPRIVVGLPNNVEVGLNFPVYHNRDSDPSNFAYIQPDIKWKFYKNDDMGLAASAGTFVNIPLNERNGQASWGVIYGNFSKKVKGDLGPRVTAGGYGVVANADPKSGPVSFVGTRGGVLLGYEQPIHGKLSFVADWYSGKNSIGYFTPGISISLPHNGLLNAGYSMGNDSLEEWSIKDKFVFVYYGVTF